MIERFNFYDIYGYLLPGSVLVGLLWLPFGIIQQAWPAPELATTVLVLGFCYVIGHVLQTIATTAVPSKIKDKRGNLRAPSDLILDVDDTSFAVNIKSSLAACVAAEFRVDLQIDKTSTGSESDEISRNRADAFFLCRGLLIREKIATYVEQFEGLYAMFRGLFLAFLIGAFYLTGWASSTCTLYCFRWAASALTGIGGIGVLISGLVAVNASKKAKKALADRWLLGFLLAAVLGFGMCLGATRSATGDYLQLFWIAVLVTSVASLRCYSGYRTFAMLFAQTVWRDFLSFKSKPEDTSKKNYNPE
ncbi:MAG TPA: hypothetical protein VLK33_16585 [Terriglobales bacterium]|nr:hypothetical protein [Terriglobales bacterium]